MPIQVPLTLTELLPIPSILFHFTVRVRTSVTLTLRTKVAQYEAPGYLLIGHRANWVEEAVLPVHLYPEALIVPRWGLTLEGDQAIVGRVSFQALRTYVGSLRHHEQFPALFSDSLKSAEIESPVMPL